MNDEKTKYYYKRRLPHYQPVGYAYFVTFRLANSLPKSRIVELIKEREKFHHAISSLGNEKLKKEKYYDYQQQYFLKYEKLLDHPNSGPTFLKKSNIAEIISEAIFYRDNRVYELIAFTVMPNHIHLVFKPFVKEDNKFIQYHVTKILQSLKAITARRINEKLKREGQLWHHESYDHVVRDQDELRRIVEYVLNNPVKAGLVEEPYKYKWTYINNSYL